MSPQEEIIPNVQKVSSDVMNGPEDFVQRIVVIHGIVLKTFLDVPKSGYSAIWLHGELEMIGFTKDDVKNATYVYKTGRYWQINKECPQDIQPQQVTIARPSTETRERFKQIEAAILDAVSPLGHKYRKEAIDAAYNREGTVGRIQQWCKFFYGGRIKGVKKLQQYEEDAFEDLMRNCLKRMLPRSLRVADRKCWIARTHSTEVKEKDICIYTSTNTHHYKGHDTCDEAELSIFESERTENSIFCLYANSAFLFPRLKHERQMDDKWNVRAGEMILHHKIAAHFEVKRPLNKKSRKTGQDQLKTSRDVKIDPTITQAESVWNLDPKTALQALIYADQQDTHNEFRNLLDARDTAFRNTDAHIVIGRGFIVRHTLSAHPIVVEGQGLALAQMVRLLDDRRARVWGYQDTIDQYV